MTIHTSSDIISHLFRHFPTKSHLYEIRIDGGGIHGDIPESTAFQCSSVNTPGVNLQVGTFKKYGIGHTHPFPTGATWTEVTLTFYQSESEKERQYFVDWQNKIYNPITNRFAFYKDYAKQMTIIQYDKKLNKTYECQCTDAYPSNISPLDKNYSAGDLSQFNVNMQFHNVNEVFFNNDFGIRIFPSLR